MIFQTILVNMFLVLRGHIRDAFETQELCEFVKSLLEVYSPTLKIFIHTWNIFSNGVSWRNIPTDNRLITRDLIEKYFGPDIAKFFVKVIIDDDENIPIIGRTDGMVGLSRIPLRGWKNYWYGQCQALKAARDECVDDWVINTRFDLFTTFPMNAKLLIARTKEIVHEEAGSVCFWSKINTGCVDNYIVGRAHQQFSLAHHFHNKIDSIIVRYPCINNPEKYVWLENARLFDVNAPQYTQNLPLP